MAYIKTEDGQGRQINVPVFNESEDGSGTWHVPVCDTSGYLKVSLQSVLDNTLWKLGTDSDGVFVLNSAGLSADEELSNVIEGTSVHPATAANSIIISNITNDGDILLLASDGGNSKAFMFIDASAPDLLLYNVGGTWTAGATTWTIPAVTLGGTQTLNNQLFDAGANDLAVSSTGSTLLTLTSTAAGANGVIFDTFHLSASPGNDEAFALKIHGYDSGSNATDWGYLVNVITTVTHASEASAWRFYAQEGNGAMNLCTTITGAGELWCDTFVNPDDGVKVSGTQVLGAQVVDARIDDAINSGDATTDGVIDAIRDALVTHGICAAA